MDSHQAIVAVNGRATNARARSLDPGRSRRFGRSASAVSRSRETTDGKGMGCRRWSQLDRYCDFLKFAVTRSVYSLSPCLSVCLSILPHAYLPRYPVHPFASFLPAASPTHTHTHTHTIIIIITITITIPHRSHDHRPSRPTDILRRMRSGVNAAAYGLNTLVKNMASKNTPANRDTTNKS